jgi:hypothetical protein
MRFVLVNHRHPREDACCALCTEKIGDTYVREIQTRLLYCDSQCYREAVTEAILLRRSNVVEGDLYFPPYRAHVRGKPTTIYAGWSKDKKAFDKLCGVTQWTLHDLRRTFATRIAELGVLPHVVERLLNHRLGAISNKTQSIVTELAEIYNLATFLPEMRTAIDLWEQKLNSSLRPHSPRHTRLSVPEKCVLWEQL